ncbi:MAG: hypothetical protein JSV52_10665 [Candidatus Zixiibacteriota bacterium]|nr:MAG: hypothetical protein JSV52_10665 [candidate division Zixibacteria bacterium]
MRQTFDISPARVTPSVEVILKNQGIPLGTDINRRIHELAGEALSKYERLARPKALLMRISQGEFEPVYRGLGRNETPAPLDAIYHAASTLALFAVTIGEPICEEISRLFETQDYAAAAMLDAAASEGAELIAHEAEWRLRDQLNENEQLPTGHGSMAFSPGYCGWHISAQAKLFDVLRPEEIGISLNDSFLMNPLKSVTGVIVVGPKEIFDFDDSFRFCGECRAHTCIDRLKILREQ